MKIPFSPPDITEAEVAMLRCAAKEKKEKMKKTADKQFLYEEICQYCKEPPAQDGTVYDEILLQKLAFLLHKLEQYRRMVAYTPIKELLGFLIQDTGYDTYVSSMPGGDQRQANIALLLERAGNFEKTSFYGLFHFIRYLETMQEQEVDFGEANILDESADVVRVMTIHKSKGLEFPICFVCGLAKQFNQMDARASILMDVELGIGVDCIDPVMRTRRKTMRKNVVAQRMKEDTRGEDLRVLYVALTRAKEKLTLTNARQRTLYGKTTPCMPSRFLSEIPEDNMEWLSKPVPRSDAWEDSRDDDGCAYGYGGYTRQGTTAPTRREVPAASRPGSLHTARTAAKAPSTASYIQLQAGETVEHDAFGRGLVLSVRPMGGDALLEVAFDTVGTKKLMLKAASHHLKKV
mgnify:CR=1 FL=1